MAGATDWKQIAPRIIYEAYPDHDLLPIEPPFDDEVIPEFSRRAEESGDTLFLFICREADDKIDALEFVNRLDRAMRDIRSVRAAFAERGGCSPDNPDKSGD